MSDREKLIYLLEPIMSGLACEHESGSCEMVDCRMCQAIYLTDHLIANGVVIQKQGEWLFHKNPRNDDYWECTVCNGTWWLESGETPQENEMYYCPMCGAKMKEVK